MPYPQTITDSPQVGVVHLGGQQEFVQYASGTISATGVVHIVPAGSVPAGYQAVVLSLALSALGTGTSAAGTAAVNLQSSTTTAVATGVFYLSNNNQVALQPTPLGWFSSAAGEGVDVNATITTCTVGITAAWCLFRPAS
jgi:hypothetical protein